MDLDLLTQQLSDRLESLDLPDRLDALEASVRERISDDPLGLRPEPEVRTSWGGRLLWTAVGFAAGTAVAYLMDPDRGGDRRSDLSGRARGVAANAANAVTPQDVPDDPKRLEARIKSEVFGGRDDVERVVLRVDGPGEVAVKGTVPTSGAERDLLAQIADVEGVKDVRSELSVSSS